MIIYSIIYSNKLKMKSKFKLNAIKSFNYTSAYYTFEYFT